MKNHRASPLKSPVKVLGILRSRRYNKLLLQVESKPTAQAWRGLNHKYSDLFSNEIWLKLIRFMRKNNQVEEARSAAHAALKSFPEDIRLWAELGEIAADEQDWRQAISVYQDTLKRFSYQVPLHIWIKLSRVHMQINEFDNALEVMAETSKHFGKNQDVMETKARYQRTINQYKSQHKKLTQILEKYYDYKPDQKGKLRVDIVLQRGTTRPTSSAFIRLISPLTQAPATKHFSIQLFDGNNYQPSTKTNICIIQRTAVQSLGQAQRIIETCKANDVKLVVDLDDSFSNIDTNHSEYLAQSKKNTALKYLIKNADHFWTSTRQVMDSFETGSSTKKYVVENTLDKRVWKSVKKTSSKANNALHLLYMGTSTHGKDLELILPVLDSLYRQNPSSFTLSIMGVSEDLPKYKWLNDLSPIIPNKLYPEFVSWFVRQNNFDVGLSPLIDSDFNRAKSDIKCLDYLAIGCVPVVSDIVPYQNPELNEFVVRIQNDPVAWEQGLGDLINKHESFLKLRTIVRGAGAEYVWQKRSSDATSQTLTDYLLSLTR